MQPWFDSHAHIADEKFSTDREAVIQRARAAGMMGWLEIGYSRTTIPHVLRMVREEGGCYAALGFHPCEADCTTRDDLVFLDKKLDEPRVVALGEIGLDVKARAPMHRQEELLRQQISVARERALPVVFHCRGAYDRLLSILREEDIGQVGGVLHCFCGGEEDLKEGLSLGLMIGIGGIVTFRNAKGMHGIACRVPLDSLLLETDSPYLAPHPHRGKRNEPSFLPWVAQWIAQLRGLEVDEVLQCSTRNVCSLLRGIQGEAMDGECR
ncbi:TatD family hydrolase [Pasteuria penetrans]|uniref:TatD family hydrolase n=1 Tax=Pasteuria penetrans TaxID=86005 RepID=UPI000F9FA4E7|nr:TatD family hydrolase [Pasteuria penetrans]